MYLFVTMIQLKADGVKTSHLVSMQKCRPAPGDSLCASRCKGVNFVSISTEASGHTRETHLKMVSLIQAPIKDR